MALLKKRKYGKRTNLLIIGAGEAGELVAKHILNNPHLNYNVLAFIDDNPSKIGNKLLEIPIFGQIEKITQLAHNLNIDEILIAIPSASGDLIRKIVNECQETNTEIKILPSSFEKLEFLEKGVAGFEDVRPISIEDFFRRKPVILDIQKIKQHYSNKTLLVTGASGSIGSEICKQLLEFNPQKLLALDHEETALHELHLKLRKKYQDKIIPAIGDIRDKEKIKKILSQYKPQIIFHAAAYKHVPMMQLHPDEAVKTNIFGTKNLIDLSHEFGVEEFVFISTDKAVNPSSVMGATKRIAELVMQSKTKTSSTKFVAVRFGNVINSRGSIVPLFEEQIEKGGPLTVTHQGIKRFFMTIPEAVQLVIQTPILGKTGDLFILDMGKQYKILDLAEDMIKLRGFTPYKDIGIEIIGLRDGDKLFEELTTTHENHRLTENERIFLIESHKFSDDFQFQQHLIELSSLLNQGTKTQIIDKLKKIK